MSRIKVRKEFYCILKHCFNIYLYIYLLGLISLKPNYFLHVDERSLKDEGVEEGGAVGEGEVAHVEGGEGGQGGVEGHLPRLVGEGR